MKQAVKEVSFLKNGWIVFGLLLGVCFLTYSNSLHNPFMLDDFNIFSDVKLRNLKFLLNSFIYPSQNIDHIESFNSSGLYYRPMAYVLSTVTFLAFGNNSFGYHVLNLFLFTVMSFTLYTFIDLLFKDKILAFVTSILFAVHPINVFYVNYITSGIHSVRFIFMFLSVILFLKAMEGAHKYIFYLISLLCFGVALLCHEASMVLPFYVLFTSIFVSKGDFKMAAFKTWPYFLILLAFLFFRILITHIPGKLSNTLSSVNAHNSFSLIATFSKIIYLYLSKLLFPNFIFFLWNALPTNRFIFIWIGGLLLLSMGWYLLLKSNPKSMSFFCVTWGVLGFLPLIVACMSEPHLGFIIEPQWLTFSSSGFFLYLAYKGLKLYPNINRLVASLLFIFLLLSWLLITRYNNWIWGDVLRYFDYWVESNDGQYRMNYLGMGNLYEGKNDYVQARYYFHKVSQQDSPENMAVAYDHLGVIDAKQGYIERAKKEFLLSIKNDPDNWAVYNNLASIFLKQEDYRSAKILLFRALKLNKYSIEVRLNLAHILIYESNFKDAIMLYKQNLDIVPNEEQSLLALVRVYLKLGDKVQVKEFSKLLIEHGKSPVILTDLGSVLGGFGYFSMAYDAFMKTLRIDANYKEVYVEAGILLMNAQKYNEAIHLWQIGETIDPKEQWFKDNISKAIRLRSKG